MSNKIAVCSDFWHFTQSCRRSIDDDGDDDWRLAMMMTFPMTMIDALQSSDQITVGREF